MGALLKGGTGVQRIKSDGLTRGGELWKIDWALQASHGVWQLLEMIGPSECQKSWRHGGSGHVSPAASDATCRKAEPIRGGPSGQIPRCRLHLTKVTFRDECRGACSIHNLCSRQFHGISSRALLQSEVEALETADDCRRAFGQILVLIDTLLGPMVII